MEKAHWSGCLSNYVGIKKNTTDALWTNVSGFPYAAGLLIGHPDVLRVWSFAAHVCDLALAIIRRVGRAYGSEGRQLALACAG
jgi:hypothetical protein